MLGDEPLEEPVLPRAGERDHILLELRESNVGDRALGDVDAEVDLSRIGFSQGEVVVDARAVEALHEQVLEMLAQLRVEAVTWKGNEQRDAPLEDVTVGKQPDLALLLEIQQLHDGRPERVGRGRQQFVEREVLDESDRDLVVV